MNKDRVIQYIKDTWNVNEEKAERIFKRYNVENYISVSNQELKDLTEDDVLKKIDKYIRTQQYNKNPAVIHSRRILELNTTIVQLMHEEWNLSFNEISKLFEKYDLYRYIKASYYNYNSMGISGILEDLKEYIETQGGHIC